MKFVDKESIKEFATSDEALKLGMKMLAWVLAFLTPIKGVLAAVGFLIVADTLTGVWSALKQGKKIESAKLRRSVTKSAAYLLAIITGFVAQKHLLEDAIPIVTVVAGLIGATETLSIYENLSQISGVPLADKVKGLLQPPKAEDLAPKKEEPPTS